MPIKEPDYQLKLTLNLLEEDTQGGGALSIEEVRLRSEVARSQLEGGKLWPGGKAPEWHEKYLAMLVGGWDWRVATYIAWAAQPKTRRWPSTQEELAIKVLGLTSDRQIVKWRNKNPAIVAMIRDVAASMVFEALPDSFAAMNQVAAMADYKGRGDRELQFKLAGILTDKTELELTNRDGSADLSKLSWDEKLRLAGLDNPEALAAMKARLANKTDEDDSDASSDAG
jgi:hypothetical protein